MFGWKNCKVGIVCAGLLLVAATDLWAQSSASVLSDGTWVRLGVTRTGVYRLDAALLSRLGLPVSSLDPRTIRLFGNGGAPLPQANAAPRPRDLQENAIRVTGEADGRFDAGDAVYFFARSPHEIAYDSLARRLTHRLNPYSDTTYYFLNVGAKAGLRIAEEAFTAPAAPLLTTYDDYQYREQELVNRVLSGREWLGEAIGPTEQVFAFNLTNLVAEAPVLITSSVVGEATVPTEFRLRWSGQIIGTQSIEAVSGFRYDRKGVENRQTFRFVPPAGTTPRLTLSYDRAGAASAQGYLNFLAVQAQRELRRGEGQLLFRSLEAAALPATRYLLKQAEAGLWVWDVSVPARPLQRPMSLNERQEGAFASPGGLREWVAFSPAQAYEPEAARRLPNQNLAQRPTPELLIVTAAPWLAEARRLASFRQQQDGLAATVVTAQEIYNEFSSGQPDPTAIRDYVRHLYRQNPATLRYLLLFGDATYDYKNRNGLMTAAQLANTVPVYESRESLHPVLTFSSDDYFGFLKPEDGEWAETFAGDHRLDIGIGRLPVRTLAEARTVVDKLIRYATDKSLAGDWQTAISFVADDGDGNIHQLDADRLATQLTENRVPLRAEKIFLDSYPQVASSLGLRAPRVNQALNQAMHEGRLIINYTGHGGESGWAEEQILTTADILSWRNNRLPLLVTATCEFGRYDNPAQTSGAELALMSARGGGIALLTTTRPVYANTNFLLNQAFYQALAEAVPQGELRLGDLMRHTKNNSLSGSLNRNFALLGDPSMRLALPAAEVALTQVNGRALGAAGDTLRALERVTLEGEVRLNNQRLDRFNGRVQLTVYDKAVEKTTLGQKGPRMAYRQYRSPLYTGQATVRQGRFRCEFVVPKDIDYRFGPGRVFAYALSADSLQVAAGTDDRLRVGGSAGETVVDTRPPQLRLFVNDTTFRAGGTVPGPDVTLIARLSDDSGINLAQYGIGHELTLQLNDSLPVVVNEQYQPDPDDSRRGTVRYRWSNLRPGAYTARLKAWDVYNNSAEATLSFIVSGKPGLVLEPASAAPNPFREQVSFRLRHNRAGEDLETELTIRDIAGRLLVQQRTLCESCGEWLDNLTWLTNQHTTYPLTPGLYLYQIRVRSKADQAEAIVTGKVLYVK